MPFTISISVSLFCREKSRTTKGIRAKISATGISRTRMMASRNSRKDLPSPLFTSCTPLKSGNLET